VTLVRQSQSSSIVDPDLEANLVAGRLDRALCRLDRLLDLLDLRDRVAELRVEHLLRQQVVAALRDAGIFRGQRISG